MHGYVHGMDMYRAWAELVVLGRFEPRPRQYAAGTVYLRGMGRAGCGPFTGPRPCSENSAT